MASVDVVKAKQDEFLKSVKEQLQWMKIQQPQAEI